MTLNKMELQEELPMFVAETNREEILRMACLAAKWKEPAKDALDTLVLNATSLEQVPPPPPSVRCVVVPGCTQRINHTPTRASRRLR
jgi:hypothetical protein